MILLFLLLPTSSIVLLFVRDKNNKRRRIVSSFLVANTIIYMMPVAYAFISTYPDGNMWSENGPGAIMWLYLIILPICLIIQAVLLVLKIVYVYSK